MSLLGMAFTNLKNLFTGPATRLYPSIKRAPFARTRGSIQIDIDACIFCGMCQRKCPTQALVVNRQDKSWEIDVLRCIMCRYCVEVCPKKCLIQDNFYHPPTRGKVIRKYAQAAKANPQTGTQGRSADPTDASSQDAGEKPTE